MHIIILKLSFEVKSGFLDNSVIISKWNNPNKIFETSNNSNYNSSLT